MRKNRGMRITAKADYAVRAAAELAAAQDDGVLVKGEQLARSQSIPQNFLENILTELRRAGIVRTRRGQHGVEAQAARHAQVQEQEAGVEVDQQVLAAPAHGAHRAPDECARLDRQRPAQGLPEAHRIDAGARDAIDNSAAGDFDFGEFRHE